MDRIDRSGRVGRSDAAAPGGGRRSLRAKSVPTRRVGRLRRRGRDPAMLGITVVAPACVARPRRSRCRRVGDLPAKRCRMAGASAVGVVSKYGRETHRRKPICAERGRAVRSPAGDGFSALRRPSPAGAIWLRAAGCIGRRRFADYRPLGRVSGYSGKCRCGFRRHRRADSALAKRHDV